MCGIFGFVANGAQTVQAERDELTLGMSAIRYRGPDGQGYWVSPVGTAGLGYVRLSIIDLDSGAQPMHSDDGRYTLVYNGEIYNYLELRKELGAESFRTKSDTEVVLRAYQRWGVSALSRLRGMFAIAIWDEREKKLFLARDRFGIKPLYWAKTQSGVYFGSEIKALLPFLDYRQVKSAALADDFTFKFCLDHPLVDFVATIPANIKFKNGELKRLLKSAFATKLPATILGRKDKTGFPVPLNDWLRSGGSAREFVGDILGSTKAKTRHYLDPSLSIDRTLDGQSAYGRNLWALLSLELWRQQFVD